MSTSGWTGFSKSDPTEIAKQRTTQVRYFTAGLALLAISALAWPILGRGLSSFEFMPHVFCYLGNRTLIDVNLISDLLIGTSYVVISLTLVYLVRASKGGIPFHWIFLAFGTFIIACGGTHFMEAITLWHPVYWAAAYVKVLTALASVATAVALPVVMPNILQNVAAVRLAEAREIDLMKANENLCVANEKLQELDRLRRRFVAQTAANVGDWEWDVAGGQVRWSEEVENMHGFARGSFGGTFSEWIRTLHPDDRDRTQATIQAAIRDKSDYDIEYRALRPDGSTFWLAGRGATEYNGSGEPVRMLGMCMDISARKRTEEALRKTEKLAAAGRLAATIAHEINNPLEAATNLLYLARVEDVAESRNRMLDMADRELRRVSHITRQTLGFYRNTTAPSRLELGEVLNRALDIFHGKLNSRGVTARICCSGEVHLSGIAGELTQVFSNLLSNAIDASPPNSEIVIRIKGVGGMAQVTIADRGAGIPAAVRAQIFEPFFTTKKDVGTGLGLWISKEIVHNHGGKIGFRSSVRPGRSGTVFMVTLERRAIAPDTAA